MGSGLGSYPLRFEFRYLVRPIVRVSFRRRDIYLVEYSTRGEAAVQSVPGAALVQLVNATDSHEDIEAFVRAYGPVLYEPDLHWRRQREATTKITARYPQLLVSPPGENPNNAVCSVSVWCDLRDTFRQLWESVGELTETAIDEVWGGQFSIDGESFIYTTRSLHAFLYLTLVANRSRLRKCPRADCPTPYFLTRHGPQTYCSDECSEGAKKASRRKWWNENRGSGSKTGKRGKK